MPSTTHRAAAVPTGPNPPHNLANRTPCVSMERAPSALALPAPGIRPPPFWQWVFTPLRPQVQWAAVITPQGHEQIPLLAVEIVAQDHAAKAQIGLHVKQLARIPVTDHARPERHHLHVATRAYAGHGKLAKPAFNLDQPEHQRRIQPGALALIPQRLQEIAPYFPFGLAAAQPG